MHLQESGEMYLETILVLTQKRRAVRSIDVAEHMGFSKPSVSRAVGLLKNGGYLSVDSDGNLSLTDLGREVAEKTYDRHNTLTDFFVLLGVDRDTAVEDACKMEHDIGDVAFRALKAHVEELRKKKENP